MFGKRLPQLLKMVFAVCTLAVTTEFAFAEPQISLEKPIQNTTHSGTRFLEIEGIVSDPDGLRALSIMLNAKAFLNTGQRGVELRERRETLGNLQGVKNFPFKFRVPAKKLKEGANKLLFRAENYRGEISVVRRSFTHVAPKGTVYLAAIGINRYQDPAVPPLKFAEADAMAVADYFQKYLGVPPKNIFTLVGRNATMRSIKRLLGITLRKKAGRNDQIIIYYAGHGVPEFDNTLTDGDQVEKYLLPWDGEANGLYATALPMREVGHLSRRFISERVVFILDTCFSGSANQQSARARTPPPPAGQRSFGRWLDAEVLRRIAAAKGKIVLTASGMNEPSHEIEKLGHGAFTYFLLEGLKGKADLDEDGFIGMSELFNYLNKTVPARTGYTQTPAYFVNETMEGDIVLGRANSGKYQIEFDGPWLGREDRGRLILKTDRNANVTIDGVSRMIRRGLLNTTLPPGRHKIAIQKPGYKKIEFDHQVEQRTTKERIVQLEKVPLHGFNRRPPAP